MTDHFPHDDDSSWITTSEMRYQQLLRKNAHPESVLSEKDMQSRQPLRLPTSSDKKELKAGISCNLCFISASDNALMEEHLMGPTHIRNVEKEVKCREKSVSVDAIARDVEASHCVQGRTDDETVHGTTSKNKNDISPELPSGWTEKKSRSSGCSYYVNNVTKVKQWKWPTEPACAQSSGTQTTDKDQLPQGWVKKKAKSNGLPFYVNKLTNDWQWDRPTESLPSKVTGDFLSSLHSLTFMESLGEPDVVRPVPRFSPPSLHSLAFMACEALPTSQLELLPSKKFKQIQALKDAPGRYKLVKPSISSRRIGNDDENDLGSGNFRYDEELIKFLLNYCGDIVVWVLNWKEKSKMWAVGSDGRDWCFTINGVSSQCEGKADQNRWIEIDSTTFKAEVDKNGIVNTKAHELVIFQGQLVAQFDIEKKILFEEDQININVRAENEHLVGEFSGQYVKLDEESSPDPDDNSCDEW